jgi:hypothetical protein
MTTKKGNVVFLMQMWDPLYEMYLLRKMVRREICNDTKGILEKIVTECERCKGNMKDVNVIEKSVAIGKGVELEKVGQLCYLDDADGGIDCAVTARVRCARNKYKELRLYLNAKGVSLRVKD